jgi:hypothetical protein
MKITWFLALLGAVLLISLLVLLELGIIQSPFVSLQTPEGSGTAVTGAQTLAPAALAGQDSVKTAANSRQESVYKLTQQGFSAKNELAKIIKTPIPKFENLNDPHSVGNYELKEEIALRVTALEALDKMASEHPQEIKKLLEEIADQQPEATLQFLVRISLDGINSNRPGKLKRTIDAMILEKEKL